MCKINLAYFKNTIVKSEQQIQLGTLRHNFLSYNKNNIF